MIQLSKSCRQWGFLDRTLRALRTDCLINSQLRCAEILELPYSLWAACSLAVQRFVRNRLVIWVIRWRRYCAACRDGNKSLKCESSVNLVSITILYLVTLQIKILESGCAFRIVWGAQCRCFMKLRYQTLCRSQGSLRLSNRRHRVLVGRGQNPCGCSLTSTRRRYVGTELQCCLKTVLVARQGIPHWQESYSIELLEILIDITTRSSTSLP